MKQILLVVLITGFLCGIADQSCLALDCQLTLTKDGAYTDKWHKASGYTSFNVTTAKTVNPEENFYILLFFSGYKTDNSGYCHLSFDVKITNPAGKIIFFQKEIPALNCKVVNPNIVMLNRDQLRKKFTYNTPLGEYLIEVTILDAVSGQTAAAQARLMLCSFCHQRFFTSDEALISWINTYYQNPTPEKAVDAYLYFAGSKMATNNGYFFPVFAFFREVFTENKFLFTHLLAVYNQQDLMRKTFILYLVRYSQFETNDFIQNLKGDELALYKKIQSETLPDPYGEIQGTPQLDMLWGSFWASGKYRPILALVKSLGLYQNNSDSVIPDSSAENPEDPKKTMLKSTYQSAVWSLTNNCTKHPLVREYCQYIFQYEKLPESTRSQLAQILGEKHTPNPHNKTLTDLRQFQQ